MAVRLPAPARGSTLLSTTLSSKESMAESVTVTLVFPLPPSSILVGLSCFPAERLAVRSVSELSDMCSINSVIVHIS